jgi:hypothetical protein
MAHCWVDGKVNLVTSNHIDDPGSGFALLKAVPLGAENKERTSDEICGLDGKAETAIDIFRQL